MPRTLRCARDHQWEVAYSDVPLEQANFFCPVCGESANRELAGPADSMKPTLPGNDPIVPTATLQPRPQIPDFEIVGELGRGGMGIVYKAKQHSRNRHVAIKVIRKEMLANNDAVKRFRREAQVAARLAHPNIVLLYDSDRIGDVYYLVMEYVAGMTLDHLVESQGPLSVPHACDYLRQAALGLQHAYEQGLVHRDIKPSNLMVTWESALFGSKPPPAPPSKGGERRAGGLVKILDMGIARLNQLSMADSLSTLTQTGSVIGTADYVAPEQLEDPRKADIRADLYSLGCTFYHLLTGRVPFPGGTLVQKLDKQRWDEPPGIEQFRTDVPPALTAVVRKLMAKKPEERYQTPGELASALDWMMQTGFAATGSTSAKLHEVRRIVHTTGITCAAISPDGARVAFAGSDGFIHLRALQSEKSFGPFEKQPQEVRSIAFSPAGDRLLTASGVSLKLWNAGTGDLVTRFAGHSSTVRSCVFFPDGKRIASAGDDRTIRIWDIDGREAQRFARHIAAVTGIAVSPDGNFLISGSRDQSLRLWDTRTGQEVRQFNIPRGQVLSVAISPDGRYALSAHFDTQLRLWDIEGGKELRRFLGHKQMVTAGVFMPDGHRIVSGSQDQTVRLWDLEIGMELASVSAHKAGVTAVLALPDGKHALSASGDHTLCLWQLPE